MNNEFGSPKFGKKQAETRKCFALIITTHYSERKLEKNCVEESSSMIIYKRNAFYSSITFIEFPAFL